MTPNPDRIEALRRAVWREAEEMGERRRIANAGQGARYIPKKPLESLSVPALSAMESGPESLRKQRPGPDRRTYNGG